MEERVIDRDKEQFLKEFGEHYGYPNGPKSIDEIRATEFKRLDANGTVYLDHAGATLYSELQLEAIFNDLMIGVYGNPHSQSDSSAVTFDILRKARQHVLNYCNASPKEYKCIFTSGATAALKLVGENFPWSPKSSFMYTMENHNSVLGIREFPIYALDQGAAAFAVDVNDAVPVDGFCRSSPAPLKLSQHPVQRRSEATSLSTDLSGDSYNLFAFPSECNFSGMRLSLDLVKLVKENMDTLLEGSPSSKGRWLVLIDAAKGCATHPPDLSMFPADFVVISFYKLFGYPTGLGALIIRDDAAKILKKTYFSGGTVAASIADLDFVKRREGIEELFEDGTSSFLSIASICHGFKILNSLTPSAICWLSDPLSVGLAPHVPLTGHTESLACYVRKVLLSLEHENGAGVCTLYGSHGSKVPCHNSGTIISFNLRRPDGSWFGYREVEKLASLSGIQLRTGCFCNPGACAKYLGLSHLVLISNMEVGHVCWDEKDIIDGKPTGAVRVSFGYMSTYEDAKKLIDFIINSFVSLPRKTGNGYFSKELSVPFPCGGSKWQKSNSNYYLKSINVYPIKSCAGFSVDKWPACSTGLLHDREWLLQSLTGEILTQKKVPEMSLLSTSIDLDKEVMTMMSPYCKVNLEIKVNTDSHYGCKQEIYLQSQRYAVQYYGDEINLWFSEAIQRPCILVRCCHSEYCFSSSKSRNMGNMGMCRDVRSRLNFPNEAQFLLISEASVSDLNSRLESDTRKGICLARTEVNPMSFRPNLVISGGEPYDEDGWTNLKIGRTCFISLGGCNRCQMINIYQKAGQVEKSNEPLATLASYRRVKGKILFGILLSCDTGKNSSLDINSYLTVGEEVHPNYE